MLNFWLELQRLSVTKQNIFFDTDLPLYATCVLLGLLGRFLDSHDTIFLGHATPEICHI